MFRHRKYQISGSGPSKEFSLEEKIQQSIRYFRVPATKDKADVLNFLINKIESTAPLQKQKAKVLKLYYTIGSVAAAACLMLFFFYNFMAYETFTGNPQCANVYFLPDHSRVVLAEGAKLKYPKYSFDRDVKLKGEAYFEVQHGSDFYVKTRSGGVMVLGTRFKVSDLNNQFMVHCYEGVVGVDYGKEKVKIEKGNEFVALSSNIEVTDDKDYGYPVYAIFKYEFENKSVEEIWPVVESFFGVKINAKLNVTKKFTGSFYTGNLEEVMEIICTPMQLNFKVKKKGNEVRIDVKEKS